MSVKRQTSTMYVTRNGMLILVTNRAEAQALSTERLVQGCMLFVIQAGSLYMLDRDGGNWYNTATGTLLSEDSQ